MYELTMRECEEGMVDRHVPMLPEFGAATVRDDEVAGGDRAGRDEGVLLVEGGEAVMERRCEGACGVMASRAWGGGGVERRVDASVRWVERRVEEGRPRAEDGGCIRIHMESWSRSDSSSQVLKDGGLTE